MKATKSILMLVIALLFVGNIPGMSQDEKVPELRRKADREQIEKTIKARKIAYITESLDLTPEEAEKFWPVYNQFETKRAEATRDIMKRFQEKDEKPAEIDDKEADKIMRDRFKEEQALLDLKVEYHEKYLEILSATKVLKLYEAENNFRRRMFEHMDEYRGPRPENREGHKRGGPDAKPQLEPVPCRR